MQQTIERTIRVLHVDDEPSFRDLTAEFLEMEYNQIEVLSAESAAEGIERFRTESDIDCIVSDYEMPGTDGIEFLQTIREEDAEFPFVLYTGKGSEEIASDAISAGVTDYLQKGSGTSQYTVLANRITNAVEQYRSKHAIEQSQKRLSLFVEQSPFAVVEWDENFEFARINDKVEEILGYSEEELIGESWETIVPESDQDAVGDVVSELLEGEGGYHSINENVRADGERIICEWHNRVVTDEDGETVAIFSQFQDITEQKAYQQELEQTNPILSTLVGTHPVGILAEDADRNVLAVNNRLLDLFGFSESPSELVGADCEQLAERVSGMVVDSEAFVADINELVTENTPVSDEEVRLQDGRTFARSHEPIELPTGEGHLWLYRDVTAQAEREAQLEALNETAQELMTATTREEIAEIGVTAARDILHLDANAIHLYDQQENALVPIAQTEGSRELVGDPPTFTEGDSIAWRVFESGEPLALDEVHADPDIYNPESPVQSELYLPIGEYGILIDGSGTSEAFDNEDLVLGELLAGSIATALEQLERTEQIRSREQELQRQNEQLDEFASVVSHDLQNPLRVAESRLELAHEECDSTHLDAVDRAHDRMWALIEDLLALAREGQRVNETESVDVAALTEECWDTVATADATIRTEIDQRIRADRSHLKQLLENLYRNAIEHGSEDVTVTVGTVDDGFYVEDNGPGIPEDDREEVFEAGYSTAADGTGFGLRIVKQIAEAHGWTITVTESAVGGARFEITGVEFTD
jgi:PAS domain S-box-containing protein